MQLLVYWYVKSLDDRIRRPEDVEDALNDTWNCP